MDNIFSHANEVKVKDLPIYIDKQPLNVYGYVDIEPLPLQHELAGVRYAFHDFYAVFSERFKTVDNTLKKAKNVVAVTDTYLRNEWTVLPKAAAITVGGLAGFVLGLRRYGVRKFVYATGGLVTMAAFCYPHEAIDLSKIGWAHAQRTWEDFKQSPKPAEK